MSQRPRDTGRKY